MGGVVDLRAKCFSFFGVGFSACCTLSMGGVDDLRQNAFPFSMTGVGFQHLLYNRSAPLITAWMTSS